MPVRTLFATNFYEADIGTPDLLEELEESCRLFADEDGAGKAWSREHGYKGYTSYASLGDLPERDPAFYDLKKLLDKQVKAPRPATSTSPSRSSSTACGSIS